MFFYELHEDEDDLYSDVVLVHDELFEPGEFFEMVQVIRRRVQDTFTTETLILAIAEGLEHDFGFTAVTDEQLTASVRVSTLDEANSLTPTTDRLPEPEWGDDDDDDDDDEDDEDEERLPDYVEIIADVDLGVDRGPRLN